MITRRYFISTKCGHSDGTPSYSFRWSLIKRKSWFPQHDDVFEEAVRNAESHYKEKNIDPSSMEIIAFNRV